MVQSIWPTSSPLPSPWLCATCGVEYAPAPRPPKSCPICTDERQYVPQTGQRWTTLSQLRDAGHSVDIRREREGLWSLTAAGVGIGQTGMLIQTGAGNVLFDVPGFIDDDAVTVVRRLGGIDAIVASHPHMYGVQSAWSAAFNNAPIWIAAADEQWLSYHVQAVNRWDEPFELFPGLVLDQIGGHFRGSTIAVWADPAIDQQASVRVVLFAGDAIFPVADGNVTFLRSYPNRIPLSANVVRRITEQVSTYNFDVLYNNFGACVPSDARSIVQFSAQRYIDWVSGKNDHLT